MTPWLGLALLAGSGLGGPPPAPELRGLWVVRTSLTSPASIDRLVADARHGGVRALFVQVRGRGDAYYASAIEPRATALSHQPSSFDPLARLIAAAHGAGLQVHAWVNASLVASSHDLPTDARHVIRRHPEWLMVPRQLASQLRAVGPRDPAYVTRLAQWTRAQSNEVEGLFVSPLHPGAATHLVDVVRDLVGRYELDGVHLDYVRYPSADFDYSSTALARFRESLVEDLAGPERARLDSRLAANPFIYTEMFPGRWAAFPAALAERRYDSATARVYVSAEVYWTATATVRPDRTHSPMANRLSTTYTPRSGTALALPSVALNEMQTRGSSERLWSV